MKVKYLLLYLLFILFSHSCSSDENFIEENDILFKAEVTPSVNETDMRVTLQLLDSYLKISGKLSHVISVVPVLDDLDTLAYYVEYDHGWDLIAGDKRVQPILAHSDDGFINWSDTINPGIKSVRGMLGIVRSAQLRGTSLPNNIWNSVDDTMNGFSVRFEQVDVDRRNRITRGEGQGKWICIDTIYVSNTTSSTKLLQTHWSQEDSFCLYTPYKYKDGILAHTQVGCVAVAAGQSLFFMKSKKTADSDLIPYIANMPFVENGTLSVSSYTNNWNLLWQADYAAKFLSFIGHNISMTYGIIDSQADPRKIRDLLDDYHISYQSVFNNNSNQYNYSIVYSSLINGSPVIVSALESDTSDYGHSFVIDGFKRVNWYMALDYVWDPYYVLTEWDVVFGDPTLLVGPVGEGGKEEEGDYSTYVHREIRLSAGSEVYFSMNWGWGNEYNEDNTYYLASSQMGNQGTYVYTPYWSSGFQHYSFVRGMIYNLQNN